MMNAFDEAFGTRPVRRPRHLVSLPPVAVRAHRIFLTTRRPRRLVPKVAPAATPGPVFDHWSGGEDTRTSGAIWLFTTLATLVLMIAAAVAVAR